MYLQRARMLSTTFSPSAPETWTLKTNYLIIEFYLPRGMLSASVTEAASDWNDALLST